jgi:hypothetical protein
MRNPATFRSSRATELAFVLAFLLGATPAFAQYRQEGGGYSQGGGDRYPNRGGGDYRGPRGGGDGPRHGGGYGGSGGGLFPGLLPILGGAIFRPPGGPDPYPVDEPPREPRPRPRPIWVDRPSPPVDDEPRPPARHPPPQPVHVQPKPPIVYASRPKYVAPPSPPIVPPPPRLTLPPPVASPPTPPAFLARALPPPPGEQRYRAGEVLVEVPPDTPQALLAPILARHRLVEVDATQLDLIGVSLRLWRIPDRRGVDAVVRELAGEGALTRIQPNYLYRSADEPSASGAAQYSLEKLHVDPSLLIAAGDPVRVAVIDTGIDETHPDLKGAIEDRFDAIGGKTPPNSLDHGTSIAGAIAARGRIIRGVAPNVRILSARAFDSDGASGALGSTDTICKGLDWAVRKQARVVNMSFAGPPDPLLHDTIEHAFAKGLTLIGAAGNAGRNSPPLYPAAEARVIAITATDEDDKLYDMANVGAYVAVSAPGVDVLLPTPRGGYAPETGTSVSAALVSGVVALMLEHRATMTPDDVRKQLMATASPLGGLGHAADFGAGLVDARKAVAGP